MAAAATALVCEPAAVARRQHMDEVEQAKAAIQSALDSRKADQELRASAADAIKSAQVAREEQEVAEAAAATQTSHVADLDEKWKEFQRMFDQLMQKSIQNIAACMGKPDPSMCRPAALIDERCAAQVLRRASRVVVLTGAGVSAESGIPTFRGADGFWTVGSKNYQPQELATWEKYNEMPEELWRWYQYRWGICRNAKPNPGHKALVELEGLVPGGIDLVTQNIDGLHRIAGSKEDRLYEVHGRIDQMRCDERLEGACLHGVGLDDPANFDRARATVVMTPDPAKREQDEPLPCCKKCGVRQRPKILWFDECYNEALYRSKSALRAAEKCDVLLIVGTQLTTGLPQRIVQAARAGGATMIRMDPLVDLKDASSAGMLHVQGKSGDALPKIVTELRSLLSEPVLAPLADLPRGGSPQPPSAATPAAPARAPQRQATLQAQPKGRSSSKTTAAAAAQAPAAQRRSASSSAVNRGALRTAGNLALRTEAPAPAHRSGPSSASRPSSSGSAGSSPPGPTFPSSGAAAAGFFVYGTLRPDDDSGASWTAKFCEGLEAEGAVLQGASLYLEDYPAVCLEKTRCVVKGMFLSPPSGKGGVAREKLMSQKLAEADRIEGYPDLYDRTLVKVRTASGQDRVAYLYHRTGRIDRAQHQRIADGDFLSRPRGK